MNRSFIHLALIVLVLHLFSSCMKESPVETQSDTSYFDTKETGTKTGGIKIIPIETARGTFNIWTKTIGNNPKIRLLTLNGGPGATHEYFECFESFLPKEGIEFIYYDQLGCGNSDNPNDTSLWDLPRYVESFGKISIPESYKSAKSA